VLRLNRGSRQNGISAMSQPQERFAVAVLVSGSLLILHRRMSFAEAAAYARTHNRLDDRPAVIVTYPIPVAIELNRS
jgi:hypothetical protein